MLKHHFLALLVTSFTHAVLSVFVYAKGKRRLTNVTYSLYSASIAFWSLFEAFAITANDPAKALFLWRLNHVGVIFIPVFFVHFVNSLLSHEKQESHKNFIYGSYVVGLIFLFANLSGRLIAEVIPKFYFNYFINPAPLYSIFFGIWVGWAIYGLVRLFQLYLGSSPARRKQLSYFSISMLIAYIGGVPNFLPTFNILVPFLIPFGTYAISIYGFFTVYAIVKYQLLDIRIVALRTGVFTLVYIPILAVPFLIGFHLKEPLKAVFGINWWLIPVTIQMILAPTGLFIYSHIRNRAEDLLLKKQRRYQQTLLQVSRGMTLIKDLNKLLRLIVHVVSRTVKIKNVSLFLLDKETNKYVPKAVRYKNELPDDSYFEEIDAVVKYLATHKRPLICDEVKLRLEQNEKAESSDLKYIELKMEQINANIIIPSFVQELLLGFLVLGDKADGQAYTQDDLDVFNVLANQAALAIENAVFYQEQGKTLAEKFHEHKVWSIGKMGAGVGHQINNRFQTLMGAAEKALNIYLADLKAVLPVGPEISNAVSPLEESISEVIREAKRGSEIAVTLTHFSRGSTDMKPISLEDGIKGALNLLSCKFPISELNLTQELPISKPMIIGNLGLLQDVFMNFLDNSHDAQTRKKNEIQQGILQAERSYVPKTNIKAILTESHCEIDIADNGIGMTEEQLNQMFIPFFTTKATTEKGTGLGMHIIKQMIDTMKGTIKIYSKYGEGTKITIALPLAKE